MAPNSRVSKFKKLSKEIDLKILEKIYVIQAPTRDDADIVIESRHTNSLLKKWDPLKQARFYHLKLKSGEKLKSLEAKFNNTEIRKLLIRYYMYEEALKLDIEEELKEKIRNEKKFKITNFERFYEKKDGQKFLGITFKRDGSLKVISPKEYAKKLTFIVKEVINNNINSRKLNTTEEIKEYIRDIESHKKYLEAEKLKPVPRGNPNGKVNEPKDDDTPSTPKPRKRASRNNLILKPLLVDTKFQRINDIYKELQSLNVNTHPNAVAVLFRSFLEMIIYQYLKKHNKISEIQKEEGVKRNGETEKKKKLIIDFIISLGVDEGNIDEKLLIKATKIRRGRPRNWIPSLMHMLGYFSKNGDSMISEPKAITPLNNYVSKKSEYLTHHDFNQFVHNEYAPSPTKDNLREIYNQLAILIQIVIKELNQQKQND